MFECYTVIKIIMASHNNVAIELFSYIKSENSLIPSISKEGTPPSIVTILLSLSNYQP